MLKTTIIAIMIATFGQGFSQSTVEQIPALFPYQFLYFSNSTEDVSVYHYVVDYVYQNDFTKHTEPDNWVHSGDYIKGAQAIFSGDFDGAGYLKNFDFGKFASIVFDMKGDKTESRTSRFEWTGKMMVAKLFDKKEKGTNTIKKIDDVDAE